MIDGALTDLTRSQAMIAVQGPLAAGLLAGMGLDGRHLKYYSFVDLAWSGSTVRLSRTGYTGEDGFECFLPADAAEKFYEAVTRAFWGYLSDKMTIPFASLSRLRATLLAFLFFIRATFAFSRIRF